jgi:4-amino-4-deoxy-L-arabinose transferase-like glycosyltransferase
MKQDTSHSRPRLLSRIFSLLPAVLALLLSAYVCLWNLGAASVKQSDEALHLRVLQTMLHENQLLPPHYENWPYYGKPPLKMWLTLPVVWAVGESLFSYRLLDGLSGIAIALACIALARSLGSSGWVGLLAVLLLFSSEEVLFGAHGLRTAVQDSLMLALSAWAYVFMARALFGPQDGTRRALAIVGLLTGFGMLAKTVAALFPLMVLGLFLFGRWFWASMLRPPSPMGVAARIWPEVLRPCMLSGSLALLVATSYFLPMFLFYPGAWQGYAMNEVVTRVQEGYHNTSHPYMYLRLFTQSRFLPLMLLLPALLWLPWRLALIFSKSEAESRELDLRSRRPQLLMLALGALLPLLVMSLVASKLSWYLLPAVVPLSLLVATAVADLLSIIWGQLLTGLRSQYAGGWKQLLAVAALLLLLPGLSMLSRRLTLRVQQVRAVEPELALDLGLRALQAQPSLAQNLYLIGDVFGPWGSLDSRAEKVLWHSVAKGSRPVPAADFEAVLVAKLNAHQPLALCLLQQDLDRLLKLHTPSSYFELPRYYGRKQPALLLTFNTPAIPSGFMPWQRGYAFGTSDLNVLYGLSPATGAKTTLAEMRSERAALTLDGDLLLARYGARAQLQLALRAKIAWPVRVSFNGQEVYTGEITPSTFRRIEFELPAQLWQPKNNVLLLQLVGWSEPGRRELARALWLKSIGLEPVVKPMAKKKL